MNFLYIFTIQVEFVVADITTADFKPESFDVIYSRDTILHIEDKKSLFANFFVSLLFVTFYVVFDQWTRVFTCRRRKLCGIA